MSVEYFEMQFASPPVTRRVTFLRCALHSRHLHPLVVGLSKGAVVVSLGGDFISLATLLASNGVMLAGLVG